MSNNNATAITNNNTGTASVTVNNGKGELGTTTWILIAHPDADAFQNALAIVAPLPPSSEDLSDLVAQIDAALDSAALEILRDEADALLTKEDLSDADRQKVQTVRAATDARLTDLSDEDAMALVASLLDAQSKVAADPELQAVFEAEDADEMKQNVAKLDDADKVQVVIDIADVLLESDGVPDSEKAQVRDVRQTAVAHQATLTPTNNKENNNNNNKENDNNNNNNNNENNNNNKEEATDQVRDFFMQDQCLPMWAWFVIGAVVLVVVLVLIVAIVAKKASTPAYHPPSSVIR